ncbi:MAG: putative phage abortive infection protein [Proteus mirabilis]|nr:putative phage abortive infection protein [Proteus mirabilis]
MLYIKPFFIYLALLLLGFSLIIYFFFDIGVFNTLSIKDLIIPGVALVVSIISLIVNGDLNKKSSFNNKFSLLLEQHNKYHDELVNNLDNKKQKEKKEEKWKLLFCCDYHTPNNYLYGNAEFSPYMRVLYHILKNIDGEFKNNYSEAKKNTSLVRSLIRNDILYYIAINSLSDKNTSFQNYRYLLKKYNFFEHLNIYDEKYLNTDGLNLKNIKLSMDDLKNTLEWHLKNKINNYFFEKYPSVFSYDNEYRNEIKFNFPTLIKYNYYYNICFYTELKKYFIKYIANIMDKHYIACQIKKILCNPDDLSKYKYYTVGLSFDYYSKYKKYMRYSDCNGKFNPIILKKVIYKSILEINADKSGILDDKIKYSDFRDGIFGKYKIFRIFVTENNFKFKDLTTYDSLKNNISFESFYKNLIYIRRNEIIKDEFKKNEFYTEIQEKYLLSLNSIDFFTEQENFIFALKQALNK